MDLIKSVFLLLSIVCPSLVYAKTVEKVSYKEVIKAIDIELDEGKVYIVGKDSSDTEIKSSKSNESCRFEMFINDETLYIKNNKKLGGCKSEYHITLPKYITANLHLGSVDAEIANLNSKIDLTLGAGNLELKDASKDVDANIGAGNVNFTNSDIPSSPCKVSIRVGAGNVELNLPKNSVIKENFNNNDQQGKAIYKNFRLGDKNYNFEFIISVGAGSLLVLPN